MDENVLGMWINDLDGIQIAYPFFVKLCSLHYQRAVYFPTGTVHCCGCGKKLRCLVFLANGEALRDDSVA